MTREERALGAAKGGEWPHVARVNRLDAAVLRTLQDRVDVQVCGQHSLNGLESESVTTGRVVDHSVRVYREDGQNEQENNLERMEGAMRMENG
jgi:hypothetical protein